MKKSQSETRKETKNHWHTVLVRNFVSAGSPVNRVKFFLEPSIGLHYFKNGRIINFNSLSSDSLRPPY